MRYAGVAQLVRASACHAEGRGFESRHSRKDPKNDLVDAGSFFMATFTYIEKEIKMY